MVAVLAKEHMSRYNYVYGMQEEFEKQLQWLFQSTITIQLLNQIKDDHRTKSVHFDIGVTNNADKRVTEGDRAATGWGKSKFISHTHLQPKYLKDDCLTRSTIDNTRNVMYIAITP